MQTEITNATHNAKLKIKYANRNEKCKTMTKEINCFEGKDG